VAGVALAGLSLSLGVPRAQPATKDGAVTITMLELFAAKPAWDVLVPNFERVYPNIRVDVTYAASSAEEFQLETTELAAGNAPDIVPVAPGCGVPISVCALAKAGYLAPLVDEPWTKRLVPAVTSLSKYAQGLYAFSPTVGVFGIWTNDDLLRKLGLKVPRTFAQLLDFCRKATAVGIVPYMLPGATSGTISNLIQTLAVATVYGKDSHWAAERRDGTVTFEGTPGWHQALQQFVDLNDAGCFQPGATGTTNQSALAQFAQGGALIDSGYTQLKGTIDASDPHFKLSQHPYPGGTAPSQTTTPVGIGQALGINAHSGEQAQQAAQTFIAFVARPKQNALLAQLEGGVTQYQFLKEQLPAYMSEFAPVFAQHRYVISPNTSWWNGNVGLALQQNAIGVITGQRSIDDVLNAMDAAWAQGPA
jgi:raffinose/stachyose/melibiose transport system substrate-binding protein